MKFLNSITLAVLSAAFASTAVIADDKAEKPGQKKRPDPAARFAKLDKDSDGKLTLDELKAGSKKKPEMAEKIMKSKDKDKDGSLTKEEFTTRPKGKDGAGKGKGKGKKKGGNE